MYEKVVTIFLSGLIPILTTIFVGWVSNRSDKAKRRQMIEDAKQRIELINAYVSSQKLVIDDDATLRIMKKRAASELYDIKAFLDNNLHGLEKPSEKQESYWLRFFLLYRMRTILAGFFRVCFFLMLIVSILFNFGVFSIVISPEFSQEVGWEWSILLFFVLVFLPTILVTLLLRWLAIKFDKPDK